MGKYAIFLGENFEDVEAVTQIDIFRRAGIELDIYGVGGKSIVSRSGIVYTAELEFKSSHDLSVNEYAGILLPGGPGTQALVKNAELLEVIRAFAAVGKLIFAICAAPLLLDRAGVLDGKRYTCFPGTQISNGKHVEERVVVDGNFITSRGLGTSLDAALKLVEVIISREKSDEIKRQVVY